MVALLWAEGNREGALRLEKLWNDLGKIKSFSLLCAYPMSVFHGDANTVPFAHVCEQHSTVFPAESYSPEARWDERMRAISKLQQKAVSVDHEVALRR